MYRSIRSISIKILELTTTLYTRVTPPHSCPLGSVSSLLIPGGPLVFVILGCAQGMAVSTEGFVAIMTSKESTRALRLVVTPDDPMSGGLDVEQAETSEARTLLQLMQVKYA